MPRSHGGALLFPNLVFLFFSATWSGMVFGIAVQPGIVHRNLSRPDLNVCTGQPMMFLW